MNCNTVWPKLLPLLLTLHIGTTATAQEGKQQLDTLLQQLQKTDAKAWLQRKDAMAASAKRLREASAILRKAAEQKQGSSDIEKQHAKILTTEIGKLGTVRKTLAELTFVDKSKAGTDAKTAQGQLQTAIAALSKLPAAAWDARIKTMQSKAKQHTSAAARLADEAKTVLARAAKKDKSAKTLDAEVQKLLQLQKLVATLDVATMTRVKPAVAVASKSAAMPKKKAMPPKKAPAKKAAPKKAPAKAATKKAAPKKPSANKPTSKKPTEVLANITVEADKDLVTFEDHVFPIFDEYCTTCHEPGDPSGGLDLTTHAGALQGGSSGRTLTPGAPDQSRLYLLVSHQEKPSMPPKEDRLAKDLLQKIHKWIQQGAANDLPHARKLAVARAKKRERALAEAAKRAKTKTTAVVVMPGKLPPIKKAYPTRPGSMRTLATSPSAPLLAVPGFRQVILMHQDGLQELGVLEFPLGQVECLSFSTDGSVLIAAGGTPGKKGGAILYDVRTGKELGQFGKQRDAVLAAAVSPDGTMVAVGGTRKRVTVTRVKDGRKMWQEQLEDWATAVAFSADGKLLATGDRQGFVVVREAANGREVHSMKPATGLISDVAFSPDSANLATTGGDRSVTLYRMRDGRRLFQQKRHRDQVLCVAWRSTSRFVTAGADGRVMQWRTNGRNEAELPRVKDWVYDIATSKDQKRIYVGDWLGRLIAYDIKTRKPVANIQPLAAPTEGAAQN